MALGNDGVNVTILDTPEKLTLVAVAPDALNKLMTDDMPLNDHVVNAASVAENWFTLVNDVVVSEVKLLQFILNTCIVTAFGIDNEVNADIVPLKLLTVTNDDRFNDVSDDELIVIPLITVTRLDKFNEVSVLDVKENDPSVYATLPTSILLNEFAVKEKTPNLVTNGIKNEVKPLDDTVILMGAIINLDAVKDVHKLSIILPKNDVPVTSIRTCKFPKSTAVTVVCATV